jgi:predicted enzyme related to lactoylglutathione lyase
MTNKTQVMVDTVMIFSTQMRQLAEFYQLGFDLQPPQAHSDNHLGFQIGDLYLGIDQVDEKWQTPGAVSLWFRVPELQQTFDRLVQLGAQVRYGPTLKPMGETLASLYDPDGNLLGLSQQRK